MTAPATTATPVTTAGTGAMTAHVISASGGVHDPGLLQLAFDSWGGMPHKGRNVRCESALSEYRMRLIMRAFSTWHMSVGGISLPVVVNACEVAGHERQYRAPLALI